MEIKYEAVFGDQELLSEAGIFTGLDVVTRNVDTDLYSYCRIEDLTYDYLRKNPVVAMRHIICTPTWSVADQKAGKLPEVSCRVNFCHKLNADWRTGEIKYIDDQVVVIKTDDVARPFVYAVERVEFKPIESPEEKAARLREEWVDSAITETEKRKDTTTDEYERLKARVKDIYDALLYGDLPVPVKE